MYMYICVRYYKYTYVDVYMYMYMFMYVCTYACCFFKHPMVSSLLLQIHVSSHLPVFLRTCSCSSFFTLAAFSYSAPSTTLYPSLAVFLSLFSSRLLEDSSSMNEMSTSEACGSTQYSIICEVATSQVSAKTFKKKSLCCASSSVSSVLRHSCMSLKGSEAGQALVGSLISVETSSVTSCSAAGSQDFNSSNSEMSESTRYGDGKSVKDAVKDALAKVSSRSMLANGALASFSG